MSRLKGITVNGSQPVEDWLNDNNIIDGEAEDIKRVMDTFIKMPHGKHRVCKLGYGNVQSLDKKPTKVRRLTDSEIRRLYGLNSKPFSTTAENVIWSIVTNGSIDLVKIAKEIAWDKPRANLSATISVVWKMLGDHDKGAGILKRHRLPGPGSPYKYELAKKISPEDAIAEYKKRASQDMPPAPRKIDDDGVSEQLTEYEETMQEDVPNPDSAHEHAAVRDVTRTVGEDLIKQILNGIIGNGELKLKIEVTHKVEVVFKTRREL